MIELKKVDGEKRPAASKITYERSSDGSALHLDPTMGETRQEQSNGNIG